MIDTYSSFFDESLYKVPVVKPNLITGEGRMKGRPWSAYRQVIRRRKRIVRWPRKVSEQIGDDL